MTNEQRLEYQLIRVHGCVRSYFNYLEKNKIILDLWFKENDPISCAADKGYSCMSEILKYIGTRDEAIEIYKREIKCVKDALEKSNDE